jgi:two-component system phosphate regulon sensor histidine kinase PhoR
MSRPVRDLTVAARRMAEGDLAIRTHVLGRDEISELAAALNHLGGSLMETLDRLREDRDLMEKVLGDMKEGVLLLGNEGRVVLVNHALRQMLYLANDVAGKYTLEVIRNADLHAMIEKAGATGETIEAEIELGHIKPLRLLVQATQLSDGTGRLLVVFVDVTEIRRLEKIRRDFVANVSHELRTPVASIRSSAETLRGALVNDPTAAVEFAGIIERNATRLGRLVDDLLDLSRIEARQFNLNPETVNLPQAVAQTLAMFKTQAGEKNIRLVAEMAAGTPAALADRRALDQVLANLIDNAIKYCQDGSTVTVRSSAVEGGIRISVEDDGPGIEARHLPRLFERFYRVDTCRSRELGGTGLGLSIVKHLVEAMGGAVAVESVPGKGSIFSISIPRA